MSILLGYLLEYQAIVDPGNVPDDLRIYAGLQMDF